MLTSPASLLGIVAIAQVGVPAAPSYPDHTRLLVVRDAEGQESTINTPADWAVRRSHILAHLQDVMGPLPGGERRVLLAVVVSETIDGPRYVRKKITYAVEPGDRVPAWLLIPKDLKSPAPGMLCLHQTTKIGKDEPVGLGPKPDLAYAKELAERGYVAIAPDYPNFGEYRVDPYSLGYASASMKGIWNHMRAVDVLTTLPEVDTGRIGAIGHSLGGHNAIFVALFDERIRAIVSSCGFNAFPDYYGGNIAGWSHAGYMPRLRSKYDLDLRKVPFDFPELVGALAPRAFFANGPTRDANFPLAGVTTCLESAGPVYRLLGHPGRLRAVHPEAEHAFPAASRAEAYRFIDDSLKP
jgi:dienelactone hydrolase